MTETYWLILFAILTPVVVALIKYALRRLQIVVLQNLSALILTGIVVVIFASITTAIEHNFKTSTAALVNTFVDACLIFTPAHWLYKFASTIYVKASA